MKRSHAIFLGATGIILAGAWFGRSKPVETKDVAMYHDVDECIRAQVLSGDVCREQFREASERHVTQAPKFTSQSACEVEYGANQCKSALFNGASVFVPAMLGFMVANHLSAGRQAQALLPPMRRAQPCPPGMTPETQPGCYAPRQSSSTTSSRSSTGWSSWSTSDGDTVSRSNSNTSGVAKVPAAAAAAPAARTTFGRVSPRTHYSGSRGFSSSTSRGGFGSSARSSSSSS